MAQLLIWCRPKTLKSTETYEELLAGIHSKEEPEKPDPSARRERLEKKLAQKFIDRHFLRLERFWKTIYDHRDNSEAVEFGINVVLNEMGAKRGYDELPPSVRGRFGDQEILDAIIAHAEGKEQPLVKEKEKDEKLSEEELSAISDFDSQEIFRDRNRDIKGIVAKARVRLRKFENSDTDFQFVVPESSTYGGHPPGFVEAVRKWAWENQNNILWTTRASMLPTLTT